MISIDVVSESNLWSKKIKKTNVFFNSLIKVFPKKYRFIKKKVSLTILLSNNKNIKKLNKKFRNKNKVTDVLSFPFYEKKILNKLINKNKDKIYLGDIIINLNEIIKMSNNQSFLNIFDKIWIHGLIHLLGYRHTSNQDFFVMQKLEDKIIKSIQ